MTRIMKQRRRPVSSRRGITLIEILVSIFVLMVGLVGIAALIPIGHDAVTKADIQHRAGEVGRRAVQEARVRGYYDASMWLYNGQSVLADAGPTGKGTQIKDDILNQKFLVIDPLSVSVGGGNARFPYATGEGASMLQGKLATTPVLSIKSQFGQGGQPMQQAQAREAFVSRDNLTFFQPQDKTQPAVQFLTNSGGNQPRLRESVYSYLFTLAAHPADPQLFTLSAVVFYKNMPRGDTSREALIAQATPLGGAEFRLRSKDSKFRKYLKVGRWILISDSNDQFKWYQILAVEENPDDLDAPDKVVSLRGPEWEFGRSGSPVAVIYEGVVSVFERVIELEGTTLWQRGQSLNDGPQRGS